MAPSLLRFRQYELDRTAHELRRDGEAVELPSSAFDCLAYLIEHRDRLVGRDELILAVWGRHDVSETLLGQTIARLRREIGDAGREQHSIRTVSRKGYRWVAAVDVGTTPPADARAPFTHDTATNRKSGECTDDAPAPPSSPPPVARQKGRFGFRAAVVCLLLVLAIAAGLLAVRARTAPPASAIEGPALILPTVVDAPPDWDWLRYGLMDLVANRLRAGQQPTVTSESVVGLVQHLRETGHDDSALLEAASLDTTSRFRVQPHAALSAGEWQVRLDVIDGGRRMRVDARASDVMLAGRRAADLLLARRGKTAPTAAGSELAPSLTDVVQRSKAAALAGRLDLARAIVTDAPASLRNSPELIWSLALVDASAGQYDAARDRLEAALRTISEEHDPALRARMLTLLGAMYLRRADVDQAQRVYDEAMAIADREHDAAILSHATAGRAVVAATRRDFDAALADFGRARVLSEASGSLLGTAQIDMNLGSVMRIRGQPAAALIVLRQAAQRLQALSSQEEWAVAVQEAASAQLSLLDFPGALATFEPLTQLQTPIANERLRWLLTLTRARALADNGRLDEAQAAAQTVGDASRAPADSLYHASAAATLAYLAQRRGDASETARLAGLALADDLERSDVLLYLQAWQLRLSGLQHSGQIAAAATETTTFVQWLARFPVKRSAALAAFAVAEQARAERNPRLALDRYADAFAQVESADLPDDIVMVGTRYVSLMIEQGDLERASEIAGRLAPWSEHDRRAAALHEQLRAALQPARTVAPSDSKTPTDR